MADEFPHVAGVEHRYVEANGIRIHLAEAGPGGSAEPPILLLHGWPQHWYMWRRVIGALGGEHRLLAPDLRGFGWTEAPGHGYDGETFAVDQVALLDALEIDRARVIGHDWGGWTAMLLGVLHPERVERMIVCNAPHPFVRPTPGLLTEAWRAWYTWVIAAPEVGRRSLTSGWITRNILSRGNVGTPFTKEEIEMYVDSFREPARADAITHLYRYYQRAFKEGATGRWRGARLTVPTLLLFGEQDRYISRKLLDGREHHPDAMRVERVPGSGHFLVDELPDLVVERARQFLAE
jgi:pimeloyl-ACP methyl ester carboxylesterase